MSKSGQSSLVKSASSTGFSIVNYPEFDPSARITTPRSILACSSEGIDVLDLQYKPLEAFSEPNLSPRLVKLRYDFFEAKRKDLLSAARRARERLCKDDMDKGRTSQPVHSASMPVLVAKGGGLDQVAKISQEKASKNLHNFGIVDLERKKLARMVSLEKQWLVATLGHELSLLKKMEKDEQFLAEEDDHHLIKMQEEARKMKELNDKRRELEEKKNAEREAELKIEREKTKQEFMR
jgi:hypothetical protein